MTILERIEGEISHLGESIRGLRGSGGNIPRIHGLEGDRDDCLEEILRRRSEEDAGCASCLLVDYDD